MYDRQSRQPITLQYLITRTRSSRGGPRSLSMDTDHSIRFSIISISLRDIFPVDRLNQPSSPINRSYLHHRILEYYFIARVVFDNDSSSPPLPFFKRILGLSLYIYIFFFFQQSAEIISFLKLRGTRLTVSRYSRSSFRYVETIPGEQIARGDVCRVPSVVLSRSPTISPRHRKLVALGRAEWTRGVQLRSSHNLLPSPPLPLFVEEFTTYTYNLQHVPPPPRVAPFPRNDFLIRNVCQ